MDLERVIEKAIINFDWEGHGLPIVRTVNDDFAADLSDEIVKAMLITQLRLEPQA